MIRPHLPSLTDAVFVGVAAALLAWGVFPRGTPLREVGAQDTTGVVRRFAIPIGDPRLEEIQDRIDNWDVREPTEEIAVLNFLKSSSQHYATLDEENTSDDNYAGETRILASEGNESDEQRASKVEIGMGPDVVRQEVSPVSFRIPPGVDSNAAEPDPLESAMAEPAPAWLENSEVDWGLVGQQRTDQLAGIKSRVETLRKSLPPPPLQLLSLVRAPKPKIALIVAMGAFLACVLVDLVWQWAFPPIVLRHQNLKDARSGAHDALETLSVGVSLTTKVFSGHDDDDSSAKTTGDARESVWDGAASIDLAVPANWVSVRQPSSVVLRRLCIGVLACSAAGVFVWDAVAKVSV